MRTPGLRPVENPHTREIKAFQRVIVGFLKKGFRQETAQLMTTARLIVSETSGRWLIALRTALMNTDVSLMELAGLADAFGRLHDDSGAILAFEASEGCAEEGFRLLQLTRWQRPGRGVLVLLDGPLAGSMPLWQEAGAIAVVTSPQRLAPIARLIRRYFDTRATTPQSFREHVWQRMPWNDTKL